MPQLAADEGLVTDLDGSLFCIPTEEIEREVYAQAVERAVVHMGIKTVSSREIADISYRSYKELGHELEVFIRAPYNLEKVALTNLYYQCAIEGFRPCFKPCPDLKRVFAAVSDRLVILTNSPAVWAVPVIMEELNLRGAVHPQNIIASDHAAVSGHKKKNSPVPFQVAQRHMDLPFNKLTMADDKAENLRIAKDLGMRTVQIHWGRPPTQKEAWVDDLTPNLAVYLR